MKTIGSIFRGIFLFASAIFAFFTIFSVLASLFALDRNYYLIPFVYFPKVLLLAGTASFIGLCIIFRRRWMLVLHGACLICLITFFIFAAAPGSPSSPPGNYWSLISVNTNKCRKDLSLLVEQIRASSPDFLCLQEVPRRITENVLASRFPSYRWCKIKTLAVGAPVPVEYIRTITYQGFIFALVTRCRMDGKHVLITTVHVKQPSNFSIQTLLNWTILRKKVALHVIGASRIRTWARHQREPLLLVGDFNAPLEANLIRRLRLKDAFSSAGSGLGFTWPSFFPFLSIDHCLYNDRIEIYHFETIPLAEFTDHYGLLVRWGFR